MRHILREKGQDAAPGKGMCPAPLPPTPTDGCEWKPAGAKVDSSGLLEGG